MLVRSAGPAQGDSLRQVEVRNQSGHTVTPEFHSVTDVEHILDTGYWRKMLETAAASAGQSWNFYEWQGKWDDLDHIVHSSGEVHSLTHATKTLCMATTRSGRNVIGDPNYCELLFLEACPMCIKYVCSSLLIEQLYQWVGEAMIWHLLNFHVAHGKYDGLTMKSVPGAASFYSKLGFKDEGPAEGGLTLFEANRLECLKIMESIERYQSARKGARQSELRH